MQGQSVTPEGYSRGTFNLYGRGGRLVYESVSFEHATGWCFRAQPFGVEPEHSVFEIQAALREGGYCRIGETDWDAVAIADRATHGAMKNLAYAEEARRLVRSAGHFE